MKKYIGLIGFVGYLAVIGYMIADHVYLRHIPALAVGECAAYVTEGDEFTPSKVLEVIKIVKIGQRSYQYQSSFSFYRGELKSDEIWWVNERYVKVDCNTGK